MGYGVSTVVPAVPPSTAWFVTTGSLMVMVNATTGLNASFSASLWSYCRMSG